MKRTVIFCFVAIMIAMSLPVSATSYSGYVRNWWVEDNADLTWYFLDQNNSAYINGLCGSGVYRLKITNANYDVVYDSLKLAARNSYKVIMEVTTCDSNINVIDMVKVCTWTGDC